MKSTFKLMLIGTMASIAMAALPITSATATAYDGTDPSATGCAKSTYVVGVTGVAYRGYYGGQLQLVASTSCGTTWARFTAARSVGSVAVWVYRQADNKWCGDQSGNGCNAAWWPNSAYSNQLYSCGYDTLAEVEVYNDGNPFWVATPLFHDYWC